jgi:hypothetical protein
LAGDRIKQYQLIESQEFTDGLKSLGDVRRLDEILRELMTAISLNPTKFPIVLGWRGLRIAKTKRIEDASGEIPPLRLHFRIMSGQRVQLLYIESEDDSFLF